MSWRGSPTCQGRSDVGSNPHSGWRTKTGPEGDSRTPKPNQPPSESVLEGGLFAWGLGVPPASGKQHTGLGFQGPQSGQEETPGGQMVKDPHTKAGGAGSVPLGKSPWHRAWHPLSIRAWRIPVDRGSWRATVPGVGESNTTERLTLSLFHLPRTTGWTKGNPA